MANYVIKVLGSTETLASLELAIQQAERLGFTSVSVANGTVGGNKGNLLTLVEGAPEGTVALKEVDGSGSDGDQSDLLDDAAGDGAVVSYGGVFVGGVLKNLALVRS